MTLGENEAAVTTIDVTLLVLCLLLRVAVTEPCAGGGRLKQQKLTISQLRRQQVHHQVSRAGSAIGL